MKKSLTVSQMTAIVTVNYQEIKSIFEKLPLNKNFNEDLKTRQRVLKDLETIIKKSLKCDPNRASTYSLFKS